MLFVEMGIYIKGQSEIAVSEQLLGLFGIDPGIKKHSRIVVTENMGCEPMNYLKIFCSAGSGIDLISDMSPKFIIF